MKFKSHRSGFTLIELLVVISIISLLSSVILASVRDARDKAQQTAYREYLGQLVNAIALYKSDHNGEYPPSFQVDSAGGFIGPSIFVGNGEMAQYIKLQNSPNFVNVDSGGGSFMVTGASVFLNSPNITCSDSKIDEYVIMFSSPRSDLKFNKVKNTGTHVYDVDTGYYYCVTPSVR